MDKTATIIMGIDPGTRKVGYAFVKKTAQFLTALDFGTVRPPAASPLIDRLFIILEALDQLVVKFQPNALAIETQFVKKNVEVALKLGMARGMAMASIYKKKKISIFEYAPKKVKLAVVGSGNASKSQVQKMMQKLLNLSSLPKEDAADALAIAVCHAHQNLNLEKKLCMTI